MPPRPFQPTTLLRTLRTRNDLLPHTPLHLLPRLIARTITDLHTADAFFTRLDVDAMNSQQLRNLGELGKEVCRVGDLFEKILRWRMGVIGEGGLRERVTEGCEGVGEVMWGLGGRVEVVVWAAGEREEEERGQEDGGEELLPALQMLRVP